ncbi:EamA family transporter [Vibrio aestuarianus]|uniref:EamA family transporter n=1 Tax=Vibrio aestuarianus TaxID=28171 RepID=UPI00237CEEA5|nr:EamA family transporter [Vibrio aestuarianus]MDE1327132.1 EamA family transporter [Vibrio aestuarianus]
MNFFGGHIYIFSMIFFTVYSQLIIKWKSSLLSDLPIANLDKMIFIIKVLLNPWIISSVMATLFAGISWMLAMSKFEIGYAYPWVSLNFVLMLLFGVLLFGEQLTISKVIGTLIIIFGITILVSDK